ncbi:flagellar biosynthetic protein FliR [Nereida sp. MMG025]|uniref:flagellar biosynthetic protein FliR n=1 Tax=Nereida sp. MMG025 TaxID=2909981 RepID=UPI001F35BA68|nr:flagellar biosynthetic protein FliR [Nereida sp. MMG025]MCF6444674.1 flagellar biosynthetic protein FliR [Nereida sp. MMG025]
MTLDLGPAVALVQLWFETYFLVFLRVSGMMALLPAFGERTVPVRVRLGITIVLTVLVGSGLTANRAPDSVGVDLVMMIPGELVIGLLMGLGLRLFVIALQIAGTIAAQSTSLSQIFGGSQNMEPQAAIGNVLFVAGLALVTMLGLHVKVVEIVLGSYSVFPLGIWPSAADTTQWGVAQIARCFELAFSLAAPFFVASLIYNVALGAINRAMPQLMVAMVGAPAITAGGLILLAILSPLLLQVWGHALASFTDDPFGLPR